MISAYRLSVRGCIAAVSFARGHSAAESEYRKTSHTAQALGTHARTRTAGRSGQNPDTVSSDYDFLFREYSIQGRWPSPDPGGLGAVNPTIPQTRDRYAYFLNNPLAFVDPLGSIHAIGIMLATNL